MAKFLSKEDEKKLIQAIKDAENQTSGEIRVHLEKKCKPKNPVERAIEVFGELGMYETEAHNGVIIYVAIDDHKIAIWGDKGIHEKVGQNFWEEEIQLMIEHFKKGEFEKGLEEAVHLVGQKLKESFPFKRNDTNELSDDISYGGLKE